MQQQIQRVIFRRFACALNELLRKEGERFFQAVSRELVQVRVIAQHDGQFQPPRNHNRKKPEIARAHHMDNVGLELLKLFFDEAFVTPHQCVEAEVGFHGNRGETTLQFDVAG